MDTAPQPRDTRNEVLDAAEAIVAESGVAALTFEAIARMAGVSKGGILYHFPSKDALTGAMIDRFTSRFDAAWADLAAGDPERHGRKLRAYVRASLAGEPGLGGTFDKACGSITAALANFPERLDPVRAQSERMQRAVETDGLDPVLATILRLAVDGLWLAENFNLARFDPGLRAAVVERLVGMTRD